MDSPFFSIIMPTYNRAKFLSTSVESVLNQDFEDWELVIVDDGSKDNTQSVVKGFEENRIRYIHQKNAGVSAARNPALRQLEACTSAFLMTMMNF